MLFKNEKNIRLDILSNIDETFLSLSNVSVVLKISNFSSKLLATNCAQTSMKIAIENWSPKILCKKK